MNYKISVIIPCYNQAKYLKDAIDSVLAQTYSNWECIIINDGSTDHTETIALAFTTKDTRIKYVKKENGGLSSARNAGLDVAVGKYIQFLDADDILLANKFETQLNMLTEPATSDKVVLYTNYTCGKAENILEAIPANGNTKFLTEAYLQELILRWESDLIIPCHSFLFSSYFFAEEQIRFDETLPNHEDFDCWIAIFSKNPQVLFYNEILCVYRLSPGSMSSNMRLMGEGFIKVLNKHLKMREYSAGIRKSLSLKKLSVLKAYKRFDLMDWKEKLSSLEEIRTYYTNRLVDILTVKDQNSN